MKIVKWISTGLLWAVTYIIGVCGVFILLNAIQNFIYVPKEYFFTLHNSPLNILEFFIIFILGKPTKWLVKFFKTKHKGMLKKETITIIKKYKIAIFIAVFLIIYIYITNVTVITNEYIKLYSPVNPTGIQYSYTDIASVNTGVYHNRILFIREKGQFYYKVKFNDGKSIDLMDLAKVHKEFNDLETYEEIEIMDEKIMKMRVSKISSDKYLHLVKFAPKYINRFQRILDNK